jgi:hypothetical protein
MSQTLEEEQQKFREKLQAEGADGFADGPRPWEQWDESGSQSDNRIWEGTARRIYPKKTAKRGFGDRLLSGLAVVAFTSLLVGVAGVYFSSNPSIPQQASNRIQPPPIVTSRQSAPAATRPPESADTAAPALASLDALSPPAAGIPAVPERPLTVLEPAITTARTTPAIPAGNIDRVAIETVVTEASVTTTVYTQQLAQAEPELVATIATTAPPFAHDSAAGSEQPVATYTEAVLDGQARGSAIEPALLAQTDDAVTTPAVTEQADAPASEAAVVEQAVAATIDTGLPEQAEVPATESGIVAPVEVTATEAAVVEPTADPASEPAFVEQAEAVLAVPAVAEQAETAVIEPATTGHSEDTATELSVVALNTTRTGIEAAPEISRKLETATQTPVLPEAKAGIWVINLSSYTRLSTAKRMLAVFKQKGVDAEIFSTTINDKPMHRIRVTGFQSSRTAKAEISALEQQLQLEDAWVSRR